MANLRREVAARVRDALHGREIDAMEEGIPELVEMLGIVPVGAISTDVAERGTLMDPDHEFWTDYYKDVSTKNAAERELTTALQSLNNDDILRVTEPYGSDAGIIYVECDDIAGCSDEQVTECVECGTTVLTEIELVHNYGAYYLTTDIDCPNCDFTRSIGTRMTRLQ